MRYEGKVYRPPSEAYSLIIQATIGCSQNTCTFCDMYREEKFRMRKLEDIKRDLKEAHHYYGEIDKIFLADGDALIMPFNMLVEILDYINYLFPHLDRVGIYASPKSILLKSVDELRVLCEKKLKIAYLGVESGSDVVLKNIKKRATSDDIIKAGQKIRESKIKLSTTLIMGLGGVKNSKEHVEGSIRVLNAINPDYLGLMTLSIQRGTEIYDEAVRGDFTELSAEEIVFETKKLIEGLNLNDSMVRSNHVSNYVHVRGVLNKDKEIVLAQLNKALNSMNLEKKKRIRDEYLKDGGL